RIKNFFQKVFFASRIRFSFSRVAPRSLQSEGRGRLHPVLFRISGDERGPGPKGFRRKTLGLDAVQRESQRSSFRVRGRDPVQGRGGAIPEPSILLFSDAGPE